MTLLLLMMLLWRNPFFAGDGIMPTGKLHGFVLSVKTASCGTRIPREWTHAWPVPLPRNEKGRRFKLLFYPLSADPAHFMIYSPAAEAVLNLDRNTVSACRLPHTSSKPLSNRRWPEGLQGIGLAEFSRLEKRLYRATEEVSFIYTGARAPTAGQKRTIRDYRKHFMMAEPDLIS